MKKPKTKSKLYSTNEIRQQFLDFFAERDHKIVDSSPLVPGNDPTLLFTNAGMVQFKDVFLGAEKRGYKRAVSSQRCVRAGGKHNDLENVGYTARHHTFFEMLGNFSFGDYFKQDAIRFAWELLTQVYAIPAEKLWITVYHTDDEAYDIWTKEIGVPKGRVIRIGDKPGGEQYQSDNFWQMADTGPCGPCSEIFYDHGADVAGGPPGSPDEDGDRYIEIWNLVFMQYDKSADGKLNPLPKPCVDTGMGLERLAAVLQNVHSNYDIDAFQHLIKVIAKLAKLKSADNSSVRVISDHIRSAAFLIADGILPSNDGRGYVLRRIIRRAARHGNKLGLDQPFLHSLVAALIEEMGQAYPILSKHRKTIEQALLQEEERFGETLANGMKILDDCLLELKGKEIPGPVVFKLYDTYGFPVDLTADIARERELTLDMPGYELAMGQQRKKSQDASQFGVDHSVRISTDTDTDFQGYEKLETAGKVQAIYRDGQALEHLKAGENAWVVLDKTPFYAESGGQAGDQGELKNKKALFTVSDTQKQGSTFIHIGSLQSGELKPGDKLTASVDKERRSATINNHSATHLLHAALRKTLGEHVQQKGSLVNAERLRFDFSHTQPLTGNEIAEIEKMVNQAIRDNHKTVAAEMSMDEAMQQGALAFFGDKYGEKVRVLTMGEFSQELCGGTHVQRTGDIGLFKIIAESGIASGVRRIEALSGQGAWNWLKATELSLAKVADSLKSNRDQVHDKINQLLERNRVLEKNLQDFKSQQASEVGGNLLGKAVEVSGIRVLAAELPDVDAKTLRETVDQIKSKLGSAAVILATVEDGKVRLVAGVSHDQTARVRASDLVSSVAEKVGGKGGGRADMAQAGGTDPSKLAAALAAVPDWIRAKVNH